MLVILLFKFYDPIFFEVFLLGPLDDILPFWHDVLQIDASNVLFFDT